MTDQQLQVRRGFALRKLALMFAAIAALAAGLLAVAAPGRSSEGDGPINGVGPSSGQVVGSASVQTGSVDTLLNFDDVAAPCVFAETVALRNYNGVLFSGGAPNDGGAILNECGNFGVTGHSPPNFLAFNCSSVLGDGGIPKLPEKVVFPNASTQVSLKIGSAGGGTVKIVGKGPRGKQTRNVALTSNLQTVSFTKRIKSLRLTTTDACILVVDDINF